MPLIKIDYNQEKLNGSISELVEGLLFESMKIYGYGKDKVSVFTSPYGESYFSTATAEIEVRAGVFEYQKSKLTKEELRLKHLAKFKAFVTEFMQSNDIQGGVVFTITFEDWKVEWIPPAK